MSDTTAPSTNVLDDALARVEALDPRLASLLRREVDDLRDGRRFGLVFNRHLPESVRLPKHPVKRGLKVALRNPAAAAKTEKDATWRVVRVEKADGPDGASTRVAHLDDGSVRPVVDLVVVREFGEPVYPGLKSVERIERGGSTPFHTVINGENLHALQALRFTHRDKVDLIYIDPPYNTGNQGWIYNDKYVDVSRGDASSKWLSFMERRLTIARDLLKDTGVIIVAIGDDEHHRLRMLMDQVFGAGNFISNVVWQGGRKNDSRYVSNGADYMLIYARNEEAMGEAGVRWREEKMGIARAVQEARSLWLQALVEAWIEVDEERSVEDLARARAEAEQRPDPLDPLVIWACRPEREEIHNHLSHLFPGGFARPDALDAEQARHTLSEWVAECLRHRPEIGPEAQRRATRAMKSWMKSEGLSAGVARFCEVEPETGRLFNADRDLSWPGGGGPRYEVMHPDTERPVRTPSGGWRFTEERLAQEIAAGRVAFGPDENKIPRGKSYLDEMTDSVATSVFEAPRTNAGQHLSRVLGDKRFPFPKDHEVLMRWIRMAVPKDAVILDFFGGSGSTAEAVMRLNAEDGGTRRSILVTNNELAVADAKRLTKDGHAPGDEEWESRGVFEHVARPRITTVVTGVRPDGSTYSDGLDANVEFFEMTYLDETRVTRAREYEAIAPLLWMHVGGVGARIEEIPAEGWALPDDAAYGVLADEDAAGPFLKALSVRTSTTSSRDEAPAPTHVFVVTDSDSHFEDVARRLPRDIKAVRLYEAYLRNFEINVEVGS